MHSQLESLTSNQDNNPKINLVYLHPHFTLPGGAGNVVLESASRLNPDKYNVWILCIRADSQFKSNYPRLSFIEIGGPLSNSLLFWVTLSWVQYKVHRVLNRLSPKIIFPNVLPANWWAFIYKLFHKDVLCLWYCHEPSAFIHFSQWIESISNPLVRISAKLLNPFLKVIDLFLVLKAPDHVVGNSKFSNRLFEKIYHKHITDYIYPGIDLNYFLPKKTKQNYLFMISRLTRFKNIQIAIEAMAKIKHKEYQLIIGGEGEEKNNLIALSKRLNLLDRVRFIGHVPSKDLPRLYAEAKLVLFTSRHEPFGMVPVEALACETPVIGPNSGGLKETIEHNHNGILLDGLTPENLANTIDDLLADSDRYTLLQQNARKSAEKFSWEQHVGKLEEILDDLTHSPTIPSLHKRRGV